MNEQINIAVIAPYRVFPARMGGQKCIALLHKYLKNLHPLFFITTPDNDENAANGIACHFLLRKSRLRYIDISGFFRIRKFIREKKITHLILEHPYLGWLGLLLRWSTGVRLIIHSHNIEALRFRSTGKWWWGILWNYERWIHRAADLNFFITEEDLEYALKKYKLQKQKCTLITYGIEKPGPVSSASRQSARDSLIRKHGIPAENKIILFNGTLDYMPNRAAVEVIISEIMPFLSGQQTIKYTVIICGKNLPPKFNELKDQPHMIYAGFVEDIDTYFMGSDLFINPVMEGGGIKTKLVEALAYGLQCVSTADGAIGIPSSLCGDKLRIVANNDWQRFNTEMIRAATTKNEELPSSFFNHFYWGHIAEKASESLIRISAPAS